MSRATSRANIKILALPPDADTQEEAKKEKKNARKNVVGKNNKNTSSKKGNDKKTPAADGTFTKNIVFKEVVTP
jgi:ATP-dependent DNA helicase PIF1